MKSVKLEAEIQKLKKLRQDNDLLRAREAQTQSSYAAQVELGLESSPVFVRAYLRRYKKGRKKPEKRTKTRPEP